MTRETLYELARNYAQNSSSTVTNMDIRHGAEFYEAGFKEAVRLIFDTLDKTTGLYDFIDAYNALEEFSQLIIDTP